MNKCNRFYSLRLFQVIYGYHYPVFEEYIGRYHYHDKYEEQY